MSIYVVATYDLTVPDEARTTLPRFLRELQAEGAEVVVAEPRGSATTAAERGVTVVMEFASQAEAGRWAGEMSGAPVRHVWVHPVDEAPVIDAALVRSASNSSLRRPLS